MRKRVMVFFVAIAATIGSVAAGPAASASGREHSPSPRVGHYRLHYNWSHTGFTPSPMVLRRDHTGFENQRSKKLPLTWSTTGDGITIVITSATATATYVGTISATGFDARPTPGTMSNDIGESGTWYAVRVEKP
jgi:hypothetical protein